MSVDAAVSTVPLWMLQLVHLITVVLKTFSLQWLCSTPEEMPLEKTKTRLETTLTGSSDVALMTTQLAVQPALAPPLEGAKTRVTAYLAAGLSN